MRLLITTQAVDLDDPVLGFMHRWIEVLAPRYQSIEVICLKRGRMHLPSNVQVHSLGKTAVSCQLSAFRKMLVRIQYLFFFYRYIWNLRRNYDAVFVHMNQEYVLLGGIFWRLSGKKIILWRNHKKGSWMTRLVGVLANTVCYTSSAAYVAHFKNAEQMPIGIDTERFVPPEVAPPTGSILFLGRIDEVKKPIEFLNALNMLVDQHIDFHADIYGDPTYPDDPYFKRFTDAAQSLVENGYVTLYPSVRNEDTPKIYGAHQIYVNLTPSGSFDKTIGEAMACGCIVVVANDAVREVIGDDFFAGDATGVARALTAAFARTPEELSEAGKHNRAFIEQEHSLALLADKIGDLFER